MPYHEDDHHHFQFFGQKELKSLYLTSAIASFVESLIAIFIPIYLWELGFELWQILSYYLLIVTAFVVLSFALLPLIRKMSDKTLMITGLPTRVVYYFGLQFITVFPPLFFLLPVLRAFGNLFFNIGYNLDFSGSSKSSNMGKEVGARFALSDIVRFSAPFIGGVLIASVGFNTSFIIAAALLIAAVLPLFVFPPRKVSEKLTGANIRGFLTDKSLRPFRISSAGYAAEKMVGMLTWPLFIFIAIGSVEQLGGMMTLALVAGILVTYFVGVFSDKGERRPILRASAIGRAMVWLVQGFLSTPLALGGAYIAAGITYRGMLVPWATQYYKLARATHIPAVFIVSQEILYNLSRIVLLVVLIALAYVLPLSIFFLAAFAIGALTSLMYLWANKEHTADLDAFVKDGE